MLNTLVMENRRISFFGPVVFFLFQNRKTVVRKIYNPAEHSRERDLSYVIGKDVRSWAIHGKVVDFHSHDL